MDNYAMVAIYAHAPLDMAFVANAYVADYFGS